MSTSNNPFLLNVGFIIHEAVGYSREFQFEDVHFAIPSDIELFDLNGTIRIERTSRGLLAHVNIRAKTPLECVRCLTTYPQLLEVNFSDLFLFSSQSTIDNDLIVPDQGILDLTELIREYMLLENPIKPICTPDCKGLCTICGSNLNETDCKHDEATIDPRMQKLKDLLDE